MVVDRQASAIEARVIRPMVYVAQSWADTFLCTYRWLWLGVFVGLIGIVVAAGLANSDRGSPQRSL